MARKQSYAVPKDPDELTSWLNEKLEKSRAPIPEFQTKLNLSFVLGHQWLVWDNNKRQLRRPAARSDGPNAPVRITVNKIGGIVERAVAKLVKNAPIPECRPVSDDDQDVSAARVGTRILSHELDRLHWRKYLTDFLFWPVSTGWAYSYIYWDPTAGPVVATSEDGKPVHEGDVCIETVPGHELAVDPSAREWHSAKYAIRTVSMTREAVWEKWGLDVDAGTEPARPLLQEVLALASHDYNNNNAGEWVSVHQLWMKPCRAAKDGMVVTWTGTTIIEKPKPFPYEHGDLPFVPMDWLPGIGTREGRTWVTDLVPMQADYNDARSREATIRRQLTPKILAPVGSIDPQRVTSRVEVVPYIPTAGEPKMFMPDSGWMNQYEAGMNRTEGEMGTRAGISEASQGQASASTPAAAILALQEADDTKLAITATQLADYTTGVGRHILLLARQYWDEQRTVRVYSEENVLDAFRYTGADIQDRLDVHVTPESALPRSKSARVQLILELHARGLIQNAQDVIRMLDIPGTDFIVRQFDLDTRKQHREISKILQSDEDPQVAPWDNHLVHIEAINGFRKTVDYEKLPVETRARVDAHAAVHEGLVLQQLGVPLPTPAPFDPNAREAADAVTAGGRGGPGGYLLDPLTGKPPDPLQVASGQAPSPVTDDGIYNQAGIGQGAGSPGRVPGIPADNQAASMGR
jgi:hypothetical protein